MIYCFSGTGNSRMVADLLRANTDVEGTFGLVFPVYAWGIPKVVEEFIDKEIDKIDANYIYAVMTCGDDIGYADRILRKHLKGRLDAVFSVQMPNTYVCLPGFDVDSDDIAAWKVRATRRHLPSIILDINMRYHTIEVQRGKYPWIKTYILRPLFNRFLMTDKYFRTTQACTHCQCCVKHCPLKNIVIDEHGKIAWGKTNCTGCLRCYHQCPNRAIEYGKFTEGKGQKQVLLRILKEN